MNTFDKSNFDPSKKVAHILTGNERSDFSLRLSSNNEEEIISIRFIPRKVHNYPTRRITVNFFSPKPGSPIRMVNKMPELDHEGNLKYDTDDGFLVNSVKNAVLIGSANGPILLIIKKVNQNTLEIEPKFDHDLLWIFSIGIASFLTKAR